MVYAFFVFAEPIIPPPPSTLPMSMPSIMPTPIPPRLSPNPPPIAPPMTPKSAAVVAMLPTSAAISVATRLVRAATGIIQYGTMLRLISSRVDDSCRCLWSKPLSIILCNLAVMSSLSRTVIGSMECFAMFFHPAFSRVTLLPQYSHVITISPNFGAIGAPQLGHFISFTPDDWSVGWGADCIVDWAVDCSCLGGCDCCLAPHLMQNEASSGSWVPHLIQYIISIPTKSLVACRSWNRTWNQ